MMSDQYCVEHVLLMFDVQLLVGDIFDELTLQAHGATSD